MAELLPGRRPDPPPARPCDNCGHSYHSDGKPMDVSFANGPDLWLCFLCFCRWMDMQPAGFENLIYGAAA